MKKYEIISYMKTLMAEALGCADTEVDESISFFKLGISSIQALKIINKMRKKLDIEINPVAMFEYKCVNDMADYLFECISEQSV